MKKLTRSLALILTLALSVAMLTGCGGSKEEPANTDTPPATEEPASQPEPSASAADELVNGVPVNLAEDNAREKLNIGVMFCDLSGNDFYAGTYRGIESRAAERNVELYVATSSNVISEEITLMENFGNMGLDAAITCFYSVDATEEVCENLMGKGMDIVNFCFSNKNHSTQYVSDNYVEGQLIAEMAAEWVKENLADKETIKVACGTIDTIDSMHNRCVAMVERFKELVPNCEIVSEAGNLDAMSKAYDWTENVILSHPDVDVFLDFCDVIALGSVEALQSAGYTGDQVAVFGMDGIAAAVEAIASENPIFKGTKACDTFAIGETMLDMAIALNTGRELEDTYMYDYITIDTSNASDYLS